VIWECALRGPDRSQDFEVFERAACYLREGQLGILEISGKIS
jgi:hypothetical protein